jgi:hypothetical protein
MARPTIRINRPRFGKRYRPAPPPVGQTDHAKQVEQLRRVVLYMRTSTIATIDYRPIPPLPIEESWSFPRYFDWCYGLPLVSDPRDFIPDTFVSSRSQVLEWQAAIRAVENGFIPMAPRDYPLFVAAWGVGFSIIRKERPS